jgi:hypothetical protein
MKIRWYSVRRTFKGQFITSLNPPLSTTWKTTQETERNIRLSLLIATFSLRPIWRKCTEVLIKNVPRIDRFKLYDKLL